MSGLLTDFRIDGYTVGRLRTIRGLGSPPPRRDVRDRAQRHGSVDQTQFYGPRMIEIAEAIVVGPAPADVWTALDGLKGALALGTEHVVRFRRAGMSADERVVARVASEVTADALHSTPGAVKWAVALLAADPRIYSDVVTSASYSPSLAAGGVRFPLTFPLSFTGDDLSVMTVTNGGNFKTPPVITVYGPARAFSVVNETTDEQIVFQGIELAAGDSIAVDVDTREVLLGGTSRPDLIDASQTTWFELAPGANRVRLHGSGFAGGTTQLAVSFRDARI